MSSSTHPVILYGIPNCSTVKNARLWLAQHDIAYQFHDFKKAGIDAALVQRWRQDLDVDVLINRKGTTWRALDPQRKAALNHNDASTNAHEATQLMIQQPSLVKRPLLLVDGVIHAGFSEAAYQSIFSILPP